MGRKGIDVGKIVDLTGQKFGRLTVIEMAKERRRGSTIWICKCECGKIKLITSDKLRQGKNTSCGFGKCKSNFVNLIGKKFGKLTVIELTNLKSGRNFVWKCKCECGKEKNIGGEFLHKGKSKSCGEYICQPNFIDITNKKFGKLTAIRIVKINLHYSWELLCECGEKIIRDYGDLREGSSCGKTECISGFKNIAGQKFGKLTAIKFTHIDNGAHWDFECSCGNQVNLFAQNVILQRTQSCGCLKKDNQYVSILSRIYSGHVHGCIKRKIENFLSREEYLSIALNPCHYCGEFDIKRNFTTKAFLKINGIDRKNNEKFYKIENSLPCCIAHNKMKGSLPYNDFLKKIWLMADQTKFLKLDDEQLT